MLKISKSPDRHSFQKEGYIKRMAEQDEPVNEDYLKMFDDILKQHEQKFDDPKSRVNNMEYDLLTTDWILEKVRESDLYAQNLYAAMCNREFQRLDVMPILKGQTWSCSWRYAGGIIADMQQKGDYIDWYCSGIQNTHEYSPEEFNDLPEDQQTTVKERMAYVGEGVVTDEIEEDLKKLGWIVLPDDMDNV